MLNKAFSNALLKTASDSRIVFKKCLNKYQLTSVFCKGSQSYIIKGHTSHQARSPRGDIKRRTLI